MQGYEKVILLCSFHCYLVHMHYVSFFNSILMGEHNFHSICKNVCTHPKKSSRSLKFYFTVLNSLQITFCAEMKNIFEAYNCQTTICTFNVCTFLKFGVASSKKYFSNKQADWCNLWLFDHYLVENSIISTEATNKTLFLLIIKLFLINIAWITIPSTEFL